MIAARYLKVLTKVNLVALALCPLASRGNAENAYQGKFILPAEAHWGGTTLPPGEYSFALPSNSAPYTRYVQEQGSSAIVTAAATDQRVVSEHPQLSLVETADEHAVQTFEAPELGVTVFYRAPTPNQLKHKEARRKTPPQAAPASHVNENKTSMEPDALGQ